MTNPPAKRSFSRAREFAWAKLACNWNQMLQRQLPGLKKQPRFLCLEARPMRDSLFGQGGSQSHVQPLRRRKRFIAKITIKTLPSTNARNANVTCTTFVLTRK